MDPPPLSSHVLALLASGVNAFQACNITGLIDLFVKQREAIAAMERDFSGVMHFVRASFPVDAVIKPGEQPANILLRLLRELLVWRASNVILPIVKDG